MKTPSLKNSLSRLVLGLLALTLLLLAGCLEQVCVWSPDGQRAAVLNLGGDGLRLCDVDGRLSPLLMPAVFRVAWLSDSQRLVLARKHNETKWTPIARALGRSRAEAVVVAAEAAWQKLQAGADWRSVRESYADREPDWAWVSICLLDRHGDALAAKIDVGERAKAADQSVEIQDLFLAQIEGEKITLGTQLFEGVDAISDFRVSPGDKAVAFVAERKEGKSKENRLWGVTLTNPAPELVADRVAAFPDWTADAHALVYVQASGQSSSADLRLATLVQREVLDAAGKLQIKPEQTDLAGLIFSDQSRVRCLRDGRILFNAAEISLPIAAADYGEQHEQFFALDPARQATLVRLIPRNRQDALPKGLSFFEVSPDERQVLRGDFNGNVCLVTLATGDVQRIQDGTKDGLQGAPVWRVAGEFTYTRRTPVKDGTKPSRAAEIVLRRGDQEKVLSQTWSAEIVNTLLSEKKP